MISSLRHMIQHNLAAKIVAYYERRPRQHLAGEIAIDPLVCSFLGEVFGA